MATIPSKKTNLSFRRLLAISNMNPRVARAWLSQGRKLHRPSA